MTEEEWKRWKDLMQSGGRWNEKKIRAEMEDLIFVGNQVSALYFELTDGHLSRPMYYADVIVSQVNDRIDKAYQEGLAEGKESDGRN